MVRIGNRDLHKSIGIALLVGISSGVISVLVDIDHLISFALGWPTTMSRFLHTPALIVAICVIICCIACLGGLLYRSILRKRYV